MTARMRAIVVFVLALALGWAASSWLAASPASVQAVKPPALVWSMPWQDDAGLQAAASAWVERAPWGASPAAAVAEQAPPPPPPPEPVGVTKDGKRYAAFFRVNGNGVMRLGPGGKLPDGGQVLQVSGRRVVWLDAEGKRQQREIFNDFQGGQ